MLDILKILYWGLALCLITAFIAGAGVSDIDALATLTAWSLAAAGIIAVLIIVSCSGSVWFGWR